MNQKELNDPLYLKVRIKQLELEVEEWKKKYHCECEMYLQHRTYNELWNTKESKAFRKACKESKYDT